jgi:hypothetical protein
MMWMLWITVVQAGQWLPEAPVVLLKEDPMVVQQQAGQGILLKSGNESARLSAQANGLFLALKTGPQGSVLLPPALRTREVTLRTSADSRIEQWRESAKGDAASWDRFESKLARWMRKGGALPQSPTPIAALAVDWEARREAFLFQEGRAPAGLLMGYAALELEGVRALSKADHPVQLLPSGRLPEDQPWTLQVQGPGVLHLEFRAEMDGQLHHRFQLLAESNGQRVFSSALSSIENPDYPGLGYLRTSKIVLPPGPQQLTLQAKGASLRVEASLLALRPPLRSVFQGWRRALRKKDNPLMAMESAHLTWQADTVVSQAQRLLAAAGTDPGQDPVSILALARLIEHHPDPNIALDLWESHPQSAVGGTALVRRWQRQQDLPLRVLVQAAELLPADPQWLAAIADALPAGFIRPRGQAIRELAGLPWGSDTHTRWTALDPDTALSTLHLAGTRGGIGRVLIRAGQSAKIQLPHLGQERYPLLRLFTEVNTEFTVDGDARKGKGQLFEALDPGIHQVQVSKGALLLLDGNLAVGGQFMRERPLSGVPGRFVLPDVGAPMEIEVLISGGQGHLVARTNTGETWELPAIDPLNRYAIRPGAWASSISFEGPDHLRVSVAMRRALEIDEPFASPAVLKDPLSSLQASSLALHSTEVPEEKVGLRLLRSAALEALGLLRSAREEARAAAANPAASPRQKRIAEVILRNAQPLALSASETGPVTLDAAAASIRLEAPTNPGDLLELAVLVGPPDSAPIYLELARDRLAEGRVAEAWQFAVEAGPAGRVDRLRIANAGSWEHITRVDNDNGAQSYGTGRMAAGLGASPLRLAKEAMVGAPWPAQDYLLLHDTQAASVQLKGQGPVVLKAVCAEWGHRAKAPDCTFNVQINGRSTTESLGADTQGEWHLDLQQDQGELRVGPVGDKEQALAVWVSHNGTHQAPESQHVRHRVGDGIRVRIRGESLVRIRVHGAAPVTVQSNQNSRIIRGEGIFPLAAPGWQNLRISGPPGVNVSLARLKAKARPRKAVPDPLRSNLPGTSDRAAAKATAHWMSQVALQPQPTPFALGRRGTLSLAGLGGLDQSGQRDHRLNYDFTGAKIAWNQRLGFRPDWLRLETQYRRSTTGHPSLWAQGEWVHVAPLWASELRVDGGQSGGATHLRGAGRVRGLFSLAPDWSVQPWVEGRFGRWSANVGDPVDPLVWNAYDTDHPWSLTAGALADWRPLRDARFRLASHLRTAPDWGLNWAEAYFRSDWMMGHHVVATILPAIGYRFQGPARQTAYWRPRVNGRLAISAYATPKLRIELASTAQWLPLQQGLEGGLSLSLQRSPQRGLRDFSPLAMPFGSALDSRVEAP